MTQVSLADFQVCSWRSPKKAPSDPFFMPGLKIKTTPNNIKIKNKATFRSPPLKSLSCQTLNQQVKHAQWTHFSLFTWILMSHY